jgi:hypothetical protein
MTNFADSKWFRIHLKYCLMDFEDSFRKVTEPSNTHQTSHGAHRRRLGGDDLRSFEVLRELFEVVTAR